MDGTIILIVLILIGLYAFARVFLLLFDKKSRRVVREVVTVKVISKSDGCHQKTLKTVRPGMKSMTNDSSRSYPLSYGVINGENVEDNAVLPRSYPSTFKLIVEYDESLYDVDVSKSFFNEVAVKQEAQMTIHRVYEEGSNKIQKIYFTE